MNAEGVAKSLFRGARAKATVRNTEIAKMWFEYKGVDYMTKIELLKKYHDMACHNLFCYSRNYAMTEAKEGYEAEWKQAGEEVKLLEEMIKEAEVPDAEDTVEKDLKEHLRKRITKVSDDITLSPQDLMCIARHIQFHTDTCFKDKKNVPLPCAVCEQPCKTEGTKTIITDPWLAFEKLGRITQIQLTPFA